MKRNFYNTFINNIRFLPKFIKHCTPDLWETWLEDDHSENISSNSTIRPLPALLTRTSLSIQTLSWKSSAFCHGVSLPLPSMQQEVQEHALIWKAPPMQWTVLSIHPKHGSAFHFTSIQPLPWWPLPQGNCPPEGASHIWISKPSIWRAGTLCQLHIHWSKR